MRLCSNVPPTVKVKYGERGARFALWTPGEKASGLFTKLRRLLRNKCVQRAPIINKMQAIYLYEAAAVCEMI